MILGFFLKAKTLAQPHLFRPGSGSQRFRVAGSLAVSNSRSSVIEGEGVVVAARALVRHRTMERQMSAKIVAG